MFGKKTRNAIWMAPDYFSKWRVLPRAFIVFYFYICHDILTWYMDLIEPSAEQTAFASIIVGLGTAWFSIFISKGNDAQKVKIVQEKSYKGGEYEESLTHSTEEAKG